MSTNQVFQQLQQDIQNELTTTNQLLFLISNELWEIKVFTSPGGMFETNIKENAATMNTLGVSVLKNIGNIENISPPRGMDVDDNQNQTSEENTPRDNSNLEEENTLRDISNVEV